MRSALTVAGSDSVGGAGIQADIKAMASVGVHATTVITAITAQNTQKVTEIFPVPTDIIQAQLDAILKDCDIKAVKTGMLYNSDIVEVVVDALEDHDMPLIVDPVMIASVGDSLSDKGLSRSLIDDLLPICELVTPNKFEAEILSGMKIHNEDDAMFACELIGKQGSSVLLKGGHMDTKNVIDYLYLSSEFTVMKNPRLRTAGHGSGCVMSAYITANIAKGLDLVNSVLRSRDMIQQAIASQYAIGRGAEIVNPIVDNSNDSVKFQILDAVDSAAEKIVDLIPHEFIPHNGMNIAYAMPKAAGPEDIAAVDRRLILHNGYVVKSGPAKFGVAEHLSFVLMEAMRVDPDTRCVMNIALTKEIEDLMEEVGFTVSRFNRKGNHTMAEMTRESISRGKSVPDAIVDKTQNGGDSMIRIFGKDPEDVISKLESIL